MQCFKFLKPESQNRISSKKIIQDAKMHAVYCERDRKS